MKLCDVFIANNLLSVNLQLLIVIFKGQFNPALFNKLFNVLLHDSTHFPVFTSRKYPLWQKHPGQVSTQIFPLGHASSQLSFGQ